MPIKPSYEELEERVERAEKALRSRARELNCLYTVFEIINSRSMGLEDRLEQIARVIAKGWQYSEIACGRVVFEGCEYTSDNFEASPWRQAADIVVDGKKVGVIEVRYREERPDNFEGPFLKEERDVINAIAGRVSRFVERMRLREALRASEEKYHTIFETTGTATIIIDQDMTISLANREFEKLSGYSREELEGKKNWREFVAKDDLARINEYRQARRIEPNSAPKNYTFKLIDKHNDLRDIFATIALIPKTGTSVASFIDITDLKQAREEREELHRRLEEALTKVLSGFLPICEYCKKIKDEKGDWNQIEVYIRDRSDAEFTHGICPECGKRLYSEEWDDDD